MSLAVNEFPIDFVHYAKCTLWKTLGKCSAYCAILCKMQHEQCNTLTWEVTFVRWVFAVKKKNASRE